MSREMDKREVTIITIPSDMPMSSVEQMLKSAVEFEWSQKMCLLRELDRLKAENDRLRNDANELADNLEKAAGNTASHYNCLIKWRAAKGVQP